MKKPAEETQPAHQQPPEPKTGYGPVLAVGFMLFLFFLTQFLAVGLLMWGATLFGFDSKKILDEVGSNTRVQFMYIFLVEGLTLYGIWAFLKIRSVPWRDIGLGRRPKIRDIGSALFIFVLYFGTLAVLTAILSSLVPGFNVEQKQQLGFEDATHSMDLILVFISLVILPPIVEEIMVRGFLYTGLRTKLTKVVSAIIASVIFGIAHLQLGGGAAPLWNAALDTMVLSFFLIYLREKTGALWAGMLVHSLKNGVAFMVLFVFS